MLLLWRQVHYFPYFGPLKPNPRPARAGLGYPGWPYRAPDRRSWGDLRAPSWCPRVDWWRENIGRVDPAVECAVYFSCVEALQNVAKHAGPGAVARLRLCRDGEALRFSVEDTGCG
jgi:hypothetical protein